MYYPYCYGYWKKLADFEKKHDHSDRAKQVCQLKPNCIETCSLVSMAGLFVLVLHIERLGESA